MNKAIFFDRDGIINELVYNRKTGKYESPHEVKDFKIMPNVINVLKKISRLNYLLFLVSNQPSYAKGKTSLVNIKLIHKKLHGILKKNNIKFKKYYYCYHHPDGIIPGYSGICSCRKPSPYFLIQSKKKYDVDLKKSWFIGDQDTDVFCGKSAGVRTILIKEKKSADKRGKSRPDYYISSIKGITGIIKLKRRENG